VTGASVGIGEQFARELAARGHDLVVVARDRARLDALAKDLDVTHGAACEVVAADLTDATQLRMVERHAAGVDVLVNNAGFGTAGRFHELDVDAEEAEVLLNVVAVVRLTHAAARGMVVRRRGGILNVASIAALQPVPWQATYGATKAFVLSFTEAVHEELRPTGVHVTCLVPGFTRSEFQRRAGIDAAAVPRLMWQEPDVVARAGLDALRRNRAVVVPGAGNRVAAAFTRVTPHALTRTAAGVIMRRATR
jgi:hypothetical protein